MRSKNRRQGSSANSSRTTPNKSEHLVAQRKDPAAVVVEFFNVASLETAATVLAICRSIVAKRQPPKVKRTKSPRAVIDVALAPK